MKITLVNNVQKYRNGDALKLNFDKRQKVSINPQLKLTTSQEVPAFGLFCVSLVMTTICHCFVRHFQTFNTFTQGQVSLLKLVEGHNIFMNFNTNKSVQLGMDGSPRQLEASIQCDQGCCWSLF